jgi:transcriptional regulator with XRE-family HTH domain
MKLKSNLKQLLELKGMTASTLARSSGVPKQTLTDWLAGTSPKNIDALKRVARVLEITIDELCFNDQPKGKPDIFEQNLDSINAGVFEVVLRKVRQEK